MKKTVYEEFDAIYSSIPASTSTKETAWQTFKAGYKLGRESMRNKAMDACEQHWSVEGIAQRCHTAIKELP